MSYIKEALLTYCYNNGINPAHSEKWPSNEELFRSIREGDRLGWTDEQMREVDDETRRNS